MTDTAASVAAEGPRNPLLAQRIPDPTVRTRYNVRVTRTDGVVIFDGAITDNDRFTMEQAEGKSTTVSLTATAAIEGMLREG